MKQKQQSNQSILYNSALILIVIIALLNVILFPIEPTAHWMIGGLLLIGVCLFVVDGFALRSQLKSVQRIAASQLDKLNELAERDPETGLYTESAFQTRLAFEVTRTRRYKHALSVMMLEISEYTAFVRTHGRVRAQQIVKDFSSMLNETLRASDIISYQGEARFSIILPETERLQALYTAERIAKRMAQFNIEQGVSLQSGIGITEFHGEDLDTLQLITEARLDQAQKQGSNQIVAD